MYRRFNTNDIPWRREDVKMINFPEQKYANKTQNVRESIPGIKYIEEFQDVRESTEKLLNHLSDLLYQCDKEINRVLLQGRYLVRKLINWVGEGRTLKCKVSDYLQEHCNKEGGWVGYGELADMGVKIINHLNVCPIIDEFMYDKPITVVVWGPKSGQDISSVLIDKKFNRVAENMKMSLGLPKAKQSRPLLYQSVVQVQDAGIRSTYQEKTVRGAEMTKEADVAVGSEYKAISLAYTRSETLKLGDAKILASASVTGVVQEASSTEHPVSQISPPHPSSPSVTELQTEQISSTDTTEEGTAPEDRVVKMSSSSIRQKSGILKHEKALISAPYSDLWREGASTSSKEAEIDPNASSLSAAVMLPVQQVAVRFGSSEFVPESSNDVRLTIKLSVIGELSKFVDLEVNFFHSCLQDTQHPNSDLSYLDLDLKRNCYSFVAKNKLTNKELDPKGIVVGDSPSSGHSRPPKNRLSRKLLPEYLIYEACRESKNQLLPLSSSSAAAAAADKWQQAGVVNLIEMDLDSLPEKPDCPNLAVLFLQGNNCLDQIPSSFFDSMPGLCFLDLSSTRIRTLPSSLFNLARLQVLLLRNCVFLDQLPSEIRKLDGVEALDFCGTELYNIPDEIGGLARLRHLQLSFYGPDDESEYVHLPSKLCCKGTILKLKELEALSIIVHPEDFRWANIARDIMLDICGLEKLIHLQFYFPEVDHFQKFIQNSPAWNKYQLRSFKFVIGHDKKRIISRVPEDVELKYAEQDKCLKFVNGDEIPKEIKTALNHADAFYLDHHINIRSLSQFGISNCKRLKFCVLRECPTVELIVAEDNHESLFPSLEHLGIHYMWKLESICRHNLPSGSFNKLKYLRVDACPKLESVFSVSTLQYLSNLVEFVVEDCGSLIKVFEGETEAVKDGTLLPRLTKLELRYLPQLVSLGDGLIVPKEKISISGCPNLKLNIKAGKSQGFKCCGCIRL